MKAEQRSKETGAAGKHINDEWDGPAAARIYSTDVLQCVLRKQELYGSQPRLFPVNAKSQ